MVFSGMVKSSLIDYPGLVSAVLFAPGCNYDCWYCHNRSLLGTDTKIISEKEVLDFLGERKKLLDGVVFSGGEAILQKNVFFFARKVKKLGFKTKLDTNGSRPDLIRVAVQEKAFDYYAVDYKAPKTKYKKVCGDSADPQKVIESVRCLLGSNVQFEVRTTVLPGFSCKHILDIAKEVPSVPLFRLNKYVKPLEHKQSDFALVQGKPIPDVCLKQWVKSALAYQKNIRV